MGLTLFRQYSKVNLSQHLPWLQRETKGMSTVHCSQAGCEMRTTATLWQLPGLALLGLRQLGSALERYPITQVVSLTD